MSERRDPLPAPRDALRAPHGSPVPGNGGTARKEAIAGEPAREPISLCDALDRMLHKGVVVDGEVMLSVAGVDLAWLDLRLLLASVDTVRDAAPRHREAP